MADLIPSTTDAASSVNTLSPAPTDTAAAVQKAGDLRSNLDTIIKNGQPWPQTSVNPGLGNSIGFLPPLLIAPNKDFNGPDNPTIIGKKLINYEFEDWLGQKITNNGLIPIDTRDRFEESKNLPKSKSELQNSPYSTRDNYLIFNDSGTDYFKHGLQILNHLTPIENPINGASDLRLSQFKNTPFENQDPIILGFEIVIDGISSPLLNGSVADFLNNYNMISEIRSKIPVYEDFKQQFIKFFKTVGTITINNEQVNLSKTKTGYAHSDSPKSLFQGGRQAYMSHYLKKIDGLNLLTESNTAEKKKYLVDYRKDVIKLDFSEDVSMSLGTLAHLYKLMYWSKPNGKSLVPENLLRFNCDIIVSEVRNFNRVKRAIGTGDIEVIKDNLSRYVYSLKECQFYFNSMPHPTLVDLSEATKTHDVTTLEFDFKYSTVKFEKFMDTGDGFGQYVGYDGGAIWKVGNAGERQNRGTASTTDSSIPRFFTVGGNKFRQNGVTSPFLINSYGNGLPSDPTGNTTGEKVDDQQNTDRLRDGGLEAIKLPTAAGIKTESTLAKLKDEQKAKLDVINKNLSAQAGGLQSLKNNLKDPNFIDRIKDAGKKGVSSLSQNLKGSNSPMNFVERLKESTKSNVKVQIANLVNNRVNLLSRTINKLGIGLVGGKGVRPPKNVYTPDLGALGNAMSNVSDRFFYDVRNDLVDFAGGALSSFLNGGINSFTKK